MELLFIIAVFCRISVISACESDWEAYQQRFGKQYTGREKEIRYAAFLRTDRMIEEFNRRPNMTYILGHNELSDRMESEVNRLKGLGLNISALSFAAQTFVDVDRATIPDAIDLRSSPCMPAVKRQGDCGSCWAFTAATPSEYQHCVKTNNSISLSEMQMVDCSKSNLGCVGGMYSTAWSDIIKAGGHMTSMTYPYTAGDGESGECKFNPTRVAVRISAFFWVASNERSMQAALSVIGPISVAISTNAKFNMYRSGIFSDPTCSSYPVNHGVVIVGYGQEGVIPYWIVRNSWGTNWGMSGYILMKRGVNICKIASHPAYPVVIAFQNRPVALNTLDTSNSYIPFRNDGFAVKTALDTCHDR